MKITGIVIQETNTITFTDNGAIHIFENGSKIADVIQENLDNFKKNGFIDLDENLEDTSNWKEFFKKNGIKIENQSAKTKEGEINISKIKHYLVHDAKNSSQGVCNLIKRLTALKNEREHSVEDILTFLEYADLPIADDGSIIAYKILNELDNAYVDVHSGNVTQHIGSYVFMSPALVNKDRTCECSQGLHIARRAYLSQFDGDKCVLVKVAPEDVITVPQGDPNKVRCCGYLIIEECPDEVYKLVKQDHPMTECKEGLKLLKRAISTDYPVTETVEITKPEGEGLIIKKLKNKKPVTKRTVRNKEAVTMDTKKFEPEQVSEKVLKKAQKQEESVSVPQLIRDMAKVKPMTKQRALAINDLRKKAKKGWSSLGLSEDQIRRIQNKIIGR